MIKSIIISILFIFIKGEVQTQSICADHNATSRSIINYCISQNGSLKFQCCFLSNSNTVMAIDLTEMNLNTVPNLMDFMNLRNISMIDLRLNSQLKSSEKDDFIGLLSLDYLYLPEQYSCPGEQHVWQSTNQTTDPKGVLCMHQKDLCANSTDICVEQNSYCVSNGPNHFVCLCKTGYYGYKCLRHGQFPIGTFFGISVAITIVLSLVFYWTQRRHVKKD